MIETYRNATKPLPEVDEEPFRIRKPGWPLAPSLQREAIDYAGLFGELKAMARDRLPGGKVSLFRAADSVSVVATVVYAGITARRDVHHIGGPLEFGRSLWEAIKDCIGEIDCQLGVLPA